MAIMYRCHYIYRYIPMCYPHNSITVNRGRSETPQNGAQWLKLRNWLPETRSIRTFTDKNRPLFRSLNYQPFMHWKLVLFSKISVTELCVRIQMHWISDQPKNLLGRIFVFVFVFFWQFVFAWLFVEFVVPPDPTKYIFSTPTSDIHPIGIKFSAQLNSFYTEFRVRSFSSHQ